VTFYRTRIGQVARSSDLVQCILSKPCMKFMCIFQLRRQNYELNCGLIFKNVHFTINVYLFLDCNFLKYICILKPEKLSRCSDSLGVGRSGDRIRRSQWSSGLRRGSAADRLLGLRVRIPPEARIFVLCASSKDKKAKYGIIKINNQVRM
jgi:hypothetical protein